MGNQLLDHDGQGLGFLERVLCMWAADLLRDIR